MIRRKFVPPNYRCSYVTPGGVAESCILHAERPEDIEQRFQERGCTQVQVTPYDFADWLERAKRAREKTIAAHGKGKATFSEGVWGDLKQYLFELFHGKCAYCENKPQDVTDGDVEHFRPKGAVAEDPGHPGYYWLAYEVTNLFPACPRCNQRGKGTHFPVAGTRATGPDDPLDAEKPLLIDPHRDSPADHLQFMPLQSFAVVRALDERGENSIECFGLNREVLLEARRARQEEIENRIRARIHKGGNLLREYLAHLRDGDEEYSASQLAEARVVTKRIRDELQAAMASSDDSGGDDGDG